MLGVPQGSVLGPSSSPLHHRTYSIQENKLYDKADDLTMVTAAVQSPGYGVVFAHFCIESNFAV